MRFLIISCLIVFYSSVCYAQLDSAFSKTDKQVAVKIQELHQHKIDTIICYYVNCIGSISMVPPDHNCNPLDIKYLIWRDHGLSFMQRFDECNNHDAVGIGNKFLDLIRYSYPTIRKEKIKYPEYILVINGKRNIYTTFVDHSCHTIFAIYTGNKTLQKDIDSFALDTRLIDDKYLNRNYVSNHRSVLNRLKNTIEAELKNGNKIRN